MLMGLGWMVAFWAAACSNPADNKPQAVVSDVPEKTPTTPAAPAGAQQTTRTYEILDVSEIGFVGSKVTGSHNGGFKSFKGEITVVDNASNQSSVRFTIDTPSLWSDNPKLTTHLKSPDFFDVEKFPTATFESTRIEPADDDYRITGSLELHGVRKQIEFPAAIEVSEERVTAQAEFVINRFDFGIEYPGKADDLIRKEVVIRFDVTAGPK